MDILAASPISPDPDVAFVGRKQESALLESLLRPLPPHVASPLQAPEPVRLITLVGPGGVGKTRLAREMLHVPSLSNERPMAFVSLAAIETAHQVPQAITRAMGNQGNEGQMAWRALSRSLIERPWLLVLDNLEHLPDLASPLADLLREAPGLTILATSRHPVGIPGERVVPLAPLPVDPGTAPGMSAAARLFVQTGRRVRPSFTPVAADLPTIEAICTRVDGLPLAIEIVGAQLRNLSPRAILATLDTAGSLIQLPIPDDPAFPEAAALAGTKRRSPT